MTYNTRIQQFPRVILANTFNFEKRELFDADPGDTEPVQVQFYAASVRSLIRFARRGLHICTKQIARNKRRTFVILFGFVGLIMAVAVAFNILFGGGVVGLVIIVIIAAAMALFSYYNSDKVALAASHGQARRRNRVPPLSQPGGGSVIAAGLPKPRLYVVDDPAPNAFATGRNPNHSAIAVTTGLLETMNRVELEGVLAHELSHVKNYDILVTTVAVIAVGAIALLADIGLRFAFWGGLSDSRRTASDSGGARRHRRDCWRWRCSCSRRSRAT